MFFDDTEPAHIFANPCNGGAGNYNPNSLTVRGDLYLAAGVYRLNDDDYETIFM